MDARAWALAAVIAVLPCCGERALELAPLEVAPTGGGELRVVGELGGHGGVVVLIDGVAAHAAVLEHPELLRVELPALPRSGVVDVELVFADGERRVLHGALIVRAPRLDVQPAS